MLASISCPPWGRVGPDRVPANLRKINYTALKSRIGVDPRVGAGAPMSRSSHPGYGNHYRHLHPDAVPPARRAALGAYTFGHGARQIRFGPVAFWGIVGGLVIMAGWSLVTATYFAFRDDVLARLIARQA